uniref:Galectin domain-containing protein n=1 Tax=Glossina pallidipes TaxID=7398 RepID=A0A1A9ZIZ0_GLOPL
MNLKTNAAKVSKCIVLTPELPNLHTTLCVAILIGTSSEDTVYDERNTLLNMAHVIIKERHCALYRLQYRNMDLGDVSEGDSFHIHGEFPECEKLFVVQFQIGNEYRDLALNLVVLPKENLMARCYREKYIWSHEEVDSKVDFHFLRGRRVWIEVLITDVAFFIALNGLHLATFEHHFSYKNIKSLQVSGGLVHIFAKRKSVDSYPQRVENSQHIGISQTNTLRSSTYDVYNVELKRRQTEIITFTKSEFIKLKTIQEERDVKTEGTKAEVVTTEDVKAEGDKAKGDKAVADQAEDDNTEEVNADPDLKYANHDLGEMREVHFLLENVTQDCALRILALVEENLIARYYKDNHNWGPEEDYSQSPYKLVPGKIVAIEVLITEPGFYIAVNGFHVCIFKHHFPYTHIKAIAIRGDIDLAYVERKLVYEYPQRAARSSHFGRIVGSGKLESDEKKEEKPQVENKESEEKKEKEEEEEQEEDLFDEIEFYEIIEQPLPKTQCVRKTYLPVPYFVCFERGFFDLGFSFVISGRVRSQALHMNVSLLTGSHRWPAPGVCYDVVFKFYNSKQGGKAPVLGENEEAIDMKSKEDLKLVIVRGKKGYETKANKKSLKTRPYKINPQYVNTALIYGDLKLIDIQIVTD